MHQQQRSGQQRGDAPALPACGQRIARRVGALQQIDRRRDRKLRGQPRQGPGAQQLHLEAREQRPRRFDFACVTRPVGGIGMQQQIAAGYGFAAGDGGGGRKTTRGRRQHQRRRALFADEQQCVAFEQRHRVPGYARHERGVSAEEIGFDAGRGELRQPILEQRAGNDSDCGFAARRGRADRKVLRFDVAGELLFERKRHQLRGAGASARRQLGLEAQYLGSADQYGDLPPAGRSACRLERTALHGGKRPAGAIGDQPHGRGIGGARHAQYEPFRHAYSVPEVLKMGRI